jgi:hypothetical protein
MDIKKRTGVFKTWNPILKRSKGLNPFTHQYFIFYLPFLSPKMLLETQPATVREMAIAGMDFLGNMRGSSTPE